MTRRKAILLSIIAAVLVMAVALFLTFHATKSQVIEDPLAFYHSEVYKRMLANREKLDSNYKQNEFTDSVRRYLDHNLSFGEIVVKIKGSSLYVSVIIFNWQNDYTAKERAREVATDILAFRASHQNLSEIVMDTYGGTFDFSTAELRPVADKALKKMNPLLAVLNSRTEGIKAAIKRINDSATIEIVNEFGIKWQPNYRDLFVERTFNIKCPLNKHGNYSRPMMDSLKRYIDSIEDRERTIMHADGLYHNHLDEYAYYPRWFNENKAQHL